MRRDLAATSLHTAEIESLAVRSLVAAKHGVDATFRLVGHLLPTEELSMRPTERSDQRGLRRPKGALSLGLAGLSIWTLVGCAKPPSAVAHAVEPVRGPGTARVAPIESASPPEADIETAFPCFERIRKLREDAQAMEEWRSRRARVGAEAESTLETVSLVELAKQGENARAEDPAPTGALLVPQISFRGTMVEELLPAELRDQWREAHAWPGSKSAELFALADRATHEVTECPSESCPDRECMIEFVGAVRDREQRLDAGLAKTLEREVARSSQVGTVLALLQEKTVDPVAQVDLAARLVGFTSKGEPLGEYARYRLAMLVAPERRQASLRALEPIADRRTAFLARFAMATLTESTAERKALLISALQALPVDDGASSLAREDARRFLLRVHAARGESRERATLAAEMFRSGVSPLMHAEVLQHAAGALHAAPPLRASDRVPTRVFVELATFLAGRAMENGEPELARHALRAIVRHGQDAATRRKARAEIARIAAAAAVGREPAMRVFTPPRPTLYHWFLVVGSHKSFEAAEKSLAAIRGRLGLETRLTESGRRDDDGTYLSIESSSAYEDLQPGLFLVVAASGDRESSAMQETWQRAKSAGVPAYWRVADVVFGCPF